jgi:hypothetical protein
MLLQARKHQEQKTREQTQGNDNSVTVFTDQSSNVQSRVVTVTPPSSAAKAGDATLTLSTIVRANCHFKSAHFPSFTDMFTTVKVLNHPELPSFIFSAGPCCAIPIKNTVPIPIGAS